MQHTALWAYSWCKVKALANEDTLLRTHCCRNKCFPVCPRAQHLLRTYILCPGHKKCFWFCSETFCFRNKCFPVCAAQEASWETMCPQQCDLIYQGLKVTLTFRIIKWKSILQNSFQSKIVKHFENTRKKGGRGHLSPSPESAYELLQKASFELNKEMRCLFGIAKRF